MDFVEQDLNSLLNIDGSRPPILSRLKGSKSSTAQVTTARGGHIDRNVDLCGGIKSRQHLGTDPRGALSAQSSSHRENNTACGDIADHRQRRLLSDQDREEIEEWTAFNKKSRQVMSSISHKIYSGVGVRTTTRDEKQQPQPLDSLENNRCAAVSPRIPTSGGGDGVRTHKHSCNAPCSRELIAGGTAIVPIVDESARIRALLVECGGGTTSETVQQGGSTPSFPLNSQMKKRPPSFGGGSRSLQFPKIEENSGVILTATSLSTTVPIRKRHHTTTASLVDEESRANANHDNEKIDTIGYSGSDSNYNQKNRLGVGMTPAWSAALWGSTHGSTREDGITYVIPSAEKGRERDVTMERQVLALRPPTNSARGDSYQRIRGNEVAVDSLFLAPEEHDYSFRQIPLEVLAHIASFCDARSLVRWGATSKKFYKLQSSNDFHFLWKDLYLRYGVKSLTSHSGGIRPSGDRSSAGAPTRRERAGHPRRGRHAANDSSSLYNEEYSSETEDEEGNNKVTAVNTTKDHLPAPEALILLSIPFSSVKSAVIDFIVQHNKEITADLESANERLRRVEARLRYRQEDLRAASQLPPRVTGGAAAAGGDRIHNNNLTSSSGSTIGAGSFTRALTLGRLNVRQEVNGNRGNENSAASGQGTEGNNTNRRDVGSGVRVTTIIPHAPAPRDGNRGPSGELSRGSRQGTFSRGVASRHELGATAGSVSLNRGPRDGVAFTPTPEGEENAYDSSYAPYSNSTSLPHINNQQRAGRGRGLRPCGHSRLESIFSDPPLATALLEEFERLVVKDVVFGGGDGRGPESRMSTITPSSYASSSDAARHEDTCGSRPIANNNNRSVSNFQQLELFFAASQSAVSSSVVATATAAAAQYRWTCVQRKFYLNDYRAAKDEVVTAASGLVRELLAARGTRQSSGPQGSAYAQLSDDTRRMLAFVFKLTEMNGEELCEYFKLFK